MVRLYNDKEKEYLRIHIEITTETKGSYKGKYTYTSDYLKSINFDIDVCKFDIRKAIPSKTYSKDVCKIINHMVASINDYKKYLENDQERNKNK